MQRFRLLVIVIALIAVIIVGFLLLNKASQDNLAIKNTSASVENNFVIKEIRDPNATLPKSSLQIKVSANILTDPIKSGTLVLNFDKNVVNASDVKMPQTLIAVNQKINNSAGTITIDFKGTTDQDLTSTFDVATINFDVLDNTVKSTTFSIDPVNSKLGTLQNTNSALEVGITQIIPVNCPTIQTPQCAPGEHLTGGQLDAEGCETAVTCVQ